MEKRQETLKALLSIRIAMGELESAIHDLDDAIRLLMKEEQNGHL